jgi:hypothetical protein
LSHHHLVINHRRSHTHLYLSILFAYRFSLSTGIVDSLVYFCKQSLPTMLTSRFSRAVSRHRPSTPRPNVRIANILQLPRGSPISRISRIRQPISSLLSRYASTDAPGGEEKVKGQVIGIDLGKHLQSSKLRSLLRYYEYTD